jgi:hypothetical protein
VYELAPPSNVEMPIDRASAGTDEMLAPPPYVPPPVVNTLPPPP